MVVEALGTFFLLWAIIGVAVNPRATKEWAALAIGAALGMGVMVFAPAHRRRLQPGAQPSGPALVSGEFGGADTFLLVYVVGPVLGALVAAVLYFQIFIAPGRRAWAARSRSGERTARSVDSTR